MSINKCVLLTGCAGQIGSAIATKLKREGYVVYGVDRIEPSALPHSEKTYETYFKCDVANVQGMTEIIEETYSKKIIPDVLINCAGIGVFTPFEFRKEEDVRAVIETNLIGTIMCSQVFCDFVIKNKMPGTILNFGSVYGVVAADHRIYGESGRNSSEIYAATKAGIIHFTRYLAKYYGRFGIRVNCISPGGLFANQDPEFVANYVYKTPLARMANADDIAESTLFMISQNAGYITGHNLIIDGGFTL